jgi:5-methylcytosine-specific restriction endonuclease McrA
MCDHGLHGHHGPASDAHAPHELPGGCVHCGCTTGYIVPGELHVGLYCDNCTSWQRWVSKRDAGVSTRSLRSQRGIAPSLRERVFARDGHRCVRCGVGASAARLVVGHIVSVRDGLELGMNDDKLYSFENLCCMCEECNAGLGAASLAMPDALRIYHRWLLNEKRMGGAS